MSSCRAILARWRHDPSLTFAGPYAAFGPALATLSPDPTAIRLVEGVALRIGRGDDPAAIAAWARRFAARRAIPLLPGFPS